KKKPDIYIGEKVILAKNYKVLNGNKEKGKEKEKEDMKSPNEDSINDSPSLISKRVKSIFGF
ncbi:MAG: hypothetical protein ACKO96_46760, partial [Flammeovirgaceae bacterium]